jgi:hypothetical protein
MKRFLRPTTGFGLAALTLASAVSLPCLPAAAAANSTNIHGSPAVTVKKKKPEVFKGDAVKMRVKQLRAKSKGFNRALNGTEPRGARLRDAGRPPQQRRAVEIDPAVYDAYVGQYEVTPTFIITISREERRLMGQAAGYSRIELLPESKTDFFVREYDAQITFAGSDKGAVTHAVLRLNGWETRARKIR